MAGLILEIATGGLNLYHRIDGPQTTIGRALDNDIILSDPTVAPHHARIDKTEDGFEIVNLADVNPLRVERRPVDRLPVSSLPLMVELGRLRVRLLASDAEVAPTRPLAGEGRRGHLFGHAGWSVFLVLACLVLGGLMFYLNAYNSFKWSDLVKFVLRETVLTLGVFVFALLIIERLLVHRWEVRQLVTAVALTYVIYVCAGVLADGLEYLFSARWPGTLMLFGWYLLAIPAAITLYLVHISHLRRGRSILLAFMIASPIAVPGLLQSPRLLGMLEDFSASAGYHNSLSPLNLHIAERVSIETFIDSARDLDPGEFSD
jgi:hypothetical protein